MEIWSFIQEELSENNNVMLVTVVERIGSSPGIVGFKMAWKKKTRKVTLYSTLAFTVLFGVL